MIVDPIRWLLGVLSDPATGVNAQLPNVPRDVGEDPPAAVTIYNELDHDWVGRGAAPAEVLGDADGTAHSILMLMLHPDPQGFKMHVLPEFEKKDPNIVTIVAVFARRKIEKQGTTETLGSMRRDLRQAVRTAFRCIAQQFESSMTAYVRNECTITLSEAGLILNSDLVEAAADMEIDALIVPLRVFDAWAMGVS